MSLSVPTAPAACGCHGCGTPPAAPPDDHGHDHGHDHHDHDPAGQGSPWRLPAMLALALGVPYGAGLVWPAVEQWGFAGLALLGALPLARRAFRSARQGQIFSIETLVCLAVIGAIIIDAAAEAAAVVMLFLLGEAIEGFAARRAQTGLRALAALIPDHARILDDTGTVRDCPAAELKPGQILLVGPGERLPTDGIIHAGESELDAAPITGESRPVAVGPGDAVAAGCLNLSGILQVTISRPVAQNSIARIIAAVGDAQARKAPISRQIDRFSRFYTPAVIVLAALVAALPPLVTGQDWQIWLYRSLALLLIACPCALVLSTPAAIASGLAVLARRGVLIKSGGGLEMLAAINHIAFDKTGTLTVGKPQLAALVALDGDENRLLTLAAAINHGSTHPIGRALGQAAAERGLALPLARAARALPGRGATARIDGETWSLLAPSRLARPLPPLLAEQASRWEADGASLTVLVDGAERPVGLIALRDRLKTDAGPALTQLAALGVGATVLTGDHAGSAAAILKDLPVQCRADLLPEAKLAALAELRQQGKVAMVGDGINDAPALAGADLGIAMGDGTDVARETADAALMTDRLTALPEAIALARATLGKIRQNIALAVGLKLLFLAGSLAGVTGLWLAVLADTGATVLVTLNALRLLRWRY